MRLLTAHKILIATAVIFFFGFALWELRNYFASDSAWALARTGLYLAVAAGFGVYLRHFGRWLK
jgi:hypothetical protein